MCANFYLVSNVVSEIFKERKRELSEREREREKKEKERITIM